MPPLARAGALAMVMAVSMAAALAGAAADASRPASRVPLPAIETAAGDRCVEDTPAMRRKHMELLKHHRDRTVRDGVRTTQHSLANCVSCHAGRKTGRVTGTDGFCSSCHAYVGVKLDCFECHADRPAAPSAANTRARP